MCYQRFQILLDIPFLFCCQWSFNPLLFERNSSCRWDSDYCLVIIMKNFVQLTLYFHWLRSPWQWVDIFRYNTTSRKVVALFADISKRERRKRNYTSLCITHLQTAFLKAILSLQSDVRSLQSESIAKWNHCKVTSFFSNYSLFVSRENSISLVSLWFW